MVDGMDKKLNVSKKDAVGCQVTIRSIIKDILYVLKVKDFR